MPIISSGNNATIAVVANQLLTVQVHGGEYTYENPVGTRLLDSGSSNVFGPFTSAGNVKLSSLQGDIFYELATLPVVASQAQFALDASGNVTGLTGITGNTAFKFAGVATSSVIGLSDVLNGLSAVFPTGFTVTANAGITSLSVAIQCALDVAQTQWVTLGVVSLSAPGSGAFNVLMPFHGYRANVVAITGGTCSISIGGAIITTATAVTNPTYTGLPASGPQILSQSAIPVINPASGTIGNNGALTLSAGLFQAYTNCWIYFTTGAVYAGSPAGAYFVKMSSTTVGTIYNHILSGQTPYIPASPVPLVTTGPGAYAALTATDAVLVSIPVPPGIMGLNGTLRLAAIFEFDGSSTSGSASLGSTINGAGTTLKTLSSAANRAGGIATNVRNRGVSNAQVTTTSSAAGETGVMAIPQYLTFDSSGQLYFQLRAYVGAAAMSVVLEGYTLEVLPQ